LVGHIITNTPGASQYFSGGIIAYSNDVKQRVLGVRADTLANYGAVSSETVLEMATGIRRLLSTDIGLAISGIAGPGGGTLDKPVGMVCIGIDTDDYSNAETFYWSGERESIKWLASYQVLKMLAVYLEGLCNRSIA
jgi:PncC family amidohydrolase